MLGLRHQPVVEAFNSVRGGTSAAVGDVVWAMLHEALALELLRDGASVADRNGVADDQAVWKRGGRCESRPGFAARLAKHAPKGGRAVFGLTACCGGGTAGGRVPAQCSE